LAFLTSKFKLGFEGFPSGHRTDFRFTHELQFGFKHKISGGVRGALLVSALSSPLAMHACCRQCRLLAAEPGVTSMDLDFEHLKPQNHTRCYASVCFLISAFENPTKRS
jgi:hypothetical protein